MREDGVDEQHGEHCDELQDRERGSGVEVQQASRLRVDLDFERVEARAAQQQDDAEAREGEQEDDRCRREYRRAQQRPRDLTEGSPRRCTRDAGRLLQ